MGFEKKRRVIFLTATTLNIVYGKRPNYDAVSFHSQTIAWKNI